MATAYKVLGQSKPAAVTPDNLYTVPALTQAVVSTLSVCNLGSLATIRVSVRVAGAAQEDKQYIVYDADVAGTDSVFFTIGMTLGAGDVVTVYSNASSVAFTLFGSEIA